MARIVSLFLLISFLLPSLAQAAAAQPSNNGNDMSVAGKRAKIVAKAAVYGFAGGLVVGIASQVVKKRSKNIFLFGSLGLYAGIALGIYVISTSKGPAPYEGPDTYQDYGDYSWRDTPPANNSLLAQGHELTYDPHRIAFDFMTLKF